MTTTASNSWLLAALLLATPAAALADTGSPPTPEQVEAAKGLYHDARELHRQGHLKEALEKALEAYKTAPTPVTALEVTQLLIEAGRLVEARDIVRAVAQLPPSPRESEKGRDARQEASTLAGTLDTRIPKIAIAGRPAGADVILDGRPFAGDASAWQGVDPGAHAIVVRSGDRVCTTINVTLAEAEARTIDLHDVAVSCHLEPAPAIAEPPPLAPAAVAPVDTRSVEPSSTGSRMSPVRAAGIVVGAAGVAAVVIGGVVALSAKSSYDSVASECPAAGCTQSAFDTRTSARSRGDAATAVMIAGGVVAAGGILMIALSPDVAAPRVGLGPRGVQVVVGF